MRPHSAVTASKKTGKLSAMVLLFLVGMSAPAQTLDETYHHPSRISARQANISMLQGPAVRIVKRNQNDSRSFSERISLQSDHASDPPVPPFLATAHGLIARLALVVVTWMALAWCLCNWPAKNRLGR